MPRHNAILIPLLLVTMTATALLCAFFCYYTVRLAYLNIAVSATAAHRGSGMLIGAFAFPLATAVFGWIAWRCARGLRARVGVLNRK